MQSSLKSNSHLSSGLLARGASLIAHQLGYKNTNIFRASLLALLDGGESPLSPTQLRMVEDVLTSRLGGNALSELNHVKFCDFYDQRQKHEAAVADLLGTAVADYERKPVETSKIIKGLLKEGEKGPVPPENITSEMLWDTISQKQDSALKALRLRQLLESVQNGTAKVIDVFEDEGIFYFDPENLLLGMVNEKGDAVLGNQIIHGLTPTGKPGHIFSQHGDRFAVCTDTQGKTTIVEFDNRNMNWPNSHAPQRYLSIIPADEIVETRELQTYTGEPIFFARIKTGYGDEYVLASTIHFVPRIGVGQLSIVDIADDCIVIHSNNNSGSLSGTRIISIRTGQELEVRNSDGRLEMTSDDGYILFDERVKIEFDGETPDGKEFREKLGGWIGTKEIPLSQLVSVWKKVALRESGKKA